MLATGEASSFSAHMVAQPTYALTSRIARAGLFFASYLSRVTSLSSTRKCAVDRC